MWLLVLCGEVDVEPVESVSATICIAYQYLKDCCNNTRNKSLQEKCLKHFMIRIEEVLPFILRTNIEQRTQSIIYQKEILLVFFHMIRQLLSITYSTTDTAPHLVWACESL